MAQIAVPIGSVPPRHESSANRWSSLLVAAFIGSLIGMASMYMWENQEGGSDKVYGAGDQSAIKPQRAAAVLASLKEKHDAVDWESAIPVSRRANPFSIDMHNAFVRDYARPVIIRGRLLDVADESGNVVVKVEMLNRDNQYRNVLVLRCRDEQQKFFARGVRGISEYAVVARCYKVEETENGYFITGKLDDALNLSEADVGNSGIVKGALVTR